jgi:hypothetical protein
MGAANNAQVRDLVYKTLGFADSSTQETVIEKAIGLTRTVEVFWKTAADGAAGDATTAQWCFEVSNKIEVTAVKYMPISGNLTANDTNYATMTLETDDGAGGSDTVIATATTTITGGTGNWTAGTFVSLTLTATTANRIVDGSSSSKALIFKIAKTAAGVVVPTGKMFVTFRLV